MSRRKCHKAQVSEAEMSQAQVSRGASVARRKCRRRKRGGASVAGASVEAQRSRYGHILLREPKEPKLDLCHGSYR
jgi:hypothetical protein